MPDVAAGSSKIEAARTKVVIRRLPPTLPEETFWGSVQTWVSENTCLWKRYVKGRAAEGNDGHAVFSRAYVLLNTVEAVAEFHRGYDGHVFRSKSGEEFQAVVELSPVQKTPYKAKVKVDARQGTIDTDPDYLSFLESLKAPPERPVLEVSGPIAQPTTTPLLEHLRVHGRPGKGNKGKDKSTTSSSDVTARRAIASVNAAAAKRAPNTNSGPILVAGKGREVSTAPSGASGSSGATPLAGEGKKKRNRNKGKGGSESQNTNANSNGAPSAKGGNQSGKQTRPERPGPTPGEAAAGIIPPPIPQAARAEGEGAGKGGRGSGRGGRGKGGKTEGKDRSAKATVTTILTKNAEGETGAARGGGGGGGGGRGRGRGRGGGGAGASSANTPAAASARIDG